MRPNNLMRLPHRVDLSFKHSRMRIQLKIHQEDRELSLLVLSITSTILPSLTTSLRKKL
jgi:hypothetical protein